MKIFVQFLLAIAIVSIPHIPQSLGLTNHGYEDPIPKELFYAASSWEKISPAAPQSKNELELLNDEVEAIIERFPGTVVEFGPGDGSKTRVILNALERRGIRDYLYIAVDHSKNVEITIQNICEPLFHIICVTINKSFENAMPDIDGGIITRQEPAAAISLGSTNNEQLAAYLKSLAMFSMVVIGQDQPPIGNSVHEHYHTPEYEGFIDDGLRLASVLTGYPTNRKGCIETRDPYSHGYIVEINGVKAQCKKLSKW
ncbi:unnamed protein product [Clonostachys chloroleuca]|uniref:Histidine-specific methyltransferase SAM-dependent domain-containing protein n=1 Tax=Clonostachys chloroleuca TaxID=1926264 RepID=A0AA35VHB2_9HYPO|nr:unnamed protein product [Clonostachys chloroleuca]